MAFLEKLVGVGGLGENIRFEGRPFWSYLLYCYFGDTVLMGKQAVVSQEHIMSLLNMADRLHQNLMI